jgi:acrylyl-CoA reductase (NADPH)
MENFRAFTVYEKNGKFAGKISTKSIQELPPGDVLIEVEYSALNYKDALSARGNKGITRQYPHTPGIDAAGIVVESAHKKFKKNDEVIVTGFDLGMNTAGGYGQYIRVSASWVVKKPKELSLKESMIIGTAGLTSALALSKMEFNGLNSSLGEILVTGASGGVGTLAVSILSNAGYDVIAATGKKESYDFLKEIGAKKIIDRQEIIDQSGKPLLKKKWKGVIDTVGGKILEDALKQTDHDGVVAVCGNAASPELNITVFPFILRGVSLIGIDSAHCPVSIREKLWKKLANEWKPKKINDIYEEISLEELNEKIELILRGKIIGRILINLKK